MNAVYSQNILSMHASDRPAHIVGVQSTEKMLKLNIYKAYEYLMYDLADPRSRDCPYLNTPWPTLLLLAAYLYFVLGCGPEIMKDRKPFKIEGVIKIYNVVQILWNLYLFGYIFPIISISERTDFSLWCLPLNYSDKDPYAVMILSGFKNYYFNKLFDLLDTVFFVLRKKNNHITYMHVHHHVAMCLISFTALKYAPGGCPASTGILNGFVHVFMYTYYFLSLTRFRKWLWWKRYLTLLQMIQFFLLFIHNLPVFFSRTCYYNPFISAVAVCQPVHFFYLFVKYYSKTYFRRKRK